MLWRTKHGPLSLMARAVVSQGFSSVNASTEPKSTSRRFSLGDGLILLGALAVCMERFREIGWFQSFPTTLARCYEAVPQILGFPPWDLAPISNRARWMTSLIHSLTHELLVRTLCPVLLGLMVAQPLIRLRRPRPPLAQIIRQSGFVTCLIFGALVGVLVLIMGAWWFSEEALSLSLTREVILLLFWPILGLPPFTVEKSWIDRLGRAVGWGWLVAMAAQAMVDYVW
jgi:hypothetical protein